MGKVKYLLYLGVSLVLIVPFQNCVPVGEMGSAHQPKAITTPGSIETGSRTGGGSNNGGAYTGKVSLVAPAVIGGGEPYVVAVKGGIAPYTFTTNSGNIQVLSTSARSFELFNEFGGVTTFILTVTDATGASDSVEIRILANDYVFNFSYALASVVEDDFVAIGDWNTRLIFVYDRQGQHLRTLAPEGDRSQSFSKHLDMEFVSGQGLLVLDKPRRKLHVFDGSFEFSRFIELGDAQSRIESLTVEAGVLHVVDSGHNRVRRYQMDGVVLSDLALNIPITSQSRLYSVAFDNSMGRTFVSDKGDQLVHVVENGVVTESIASVSVTGGATQALVGPKHIKIAPTGEILLQDGLFGEGPYAGMNHGSQMGEQHLYVVDYQPGTGFVGGQQQSRSVGNWFLPTDCLQFLSAGQYTYCDDQRYLRIRNLSDNSSAEHIHPARGNRFIFEEPQNLAVDSDGSVFAINNNRFITALNPDLSQNLRVDVFDDLGGAASDLIVVGESLYVSSSGGKKIGVFDKNTLTLQSEFQVLDDSGNAMAPIALELINSQLFITSDSASYLVYDLSGNKIRQVNELNWRNNSQGPIATDRGRAIKMDSSGHLYIHHINAAVILKVDPSTDTILRWFDRNKTIDAMEMDENDNLILAVDNKIEVVDSQTWNTLYTFGGSGSEPGAFNQVSDLFLLNNALYVTDFYNQRLQLIQFQSQ